MLINVHFPFSNKTLNKLDLDIFVHKWKFWLSVQSCCSNNHAPLFASSSSDSNSDSDEEEEESMSEGEMARLMEEVEEKKKLIATIRNKPWRMKRRLTHLK